jgi:alanine-alpha-ketoisovalerate/valine-pyruvate aminotransferase
MKTWSDVCNRIELEVKHWFNIQCHDTSIRYYVYYLPFKEGRDTGIIIVSKPPCNTDYWLATDEPMRLNATVEQEVYRLSELFRKLPCLDADAEYHRLKQLHNL